MGTHPIFESDFDCLTERDGFPGKVEMADAEKTLTVDNGPEVLDRKTEHILKRRKQYQGIKRKEKEIARTTRTKRSAPSIQFKRLEHLARGKKMGKRDGIRIKAERTAIVAQQQGDEGEGKRQNGARHSHQE